MARQSARNRLRSAFEHFMGYANIETVRFLYEVIELAFNCGLELPDAFAQEIEADFTWVKVPDGPRGPR